ncbi:MAG: hypothetical protein HY320_08005 [Armatimonadetes bacterium]|nr:hypothetical protein [Armatimonadota bacterium]
MPIEIDFPPEVEARLQEEAARQGQAPADYVRDLVKRFFFFLHDTDVAEAPADYVRDLVKRQLLMSELEALKERQPPQSLADLKPRIPPPPGKSWLEGVIGQWPGDESDEEIERALAELS